MIWLKLKGYAAYILGLLVAALSFVMVNERRKTWKDRAKRYQKQANRAAEVARADNEIEIEFDQHQADVLNEIKKGRGSSVFRDPNKLFGRKNNT